MDVVRNRSTFQLRGVRVQIPKCAIMSRIYDRQLECGCLISSDGGGAIIPCCYLGYGLYSEEEEKELERKCNEAWEKWKQTDDYIIWQYECYANNTTNPISFDEWLKREGLQLKSSKHKKRQGEMERIAYQRRHLRNPCIDDSPKTKERLIELVKRYQFIKLKEKKLKKEKYKCWKAIQRICDFYDVSWKDYKEIDNINGELVEWIK